MRPVFKPLEGFAWPRRVGELAQRDAFLDVLTFDRHTVDRQVGIEAEYEINDDGGLCRNGF